MDRILSSMGRCDFRKSCGADSLDKRDERSQRKASGQMKYDELCVMYYHIQLLLFVALNSGACGVSQQSWLLLPKGGNSGSCASSRCISGSISLHLATILDY